MMKKNALVWMSLVSIFLNPALKADTQNLRTVDYVVVGVGTAGAVMAKKLSNDKKTTVVAIHNGPNLTEDPLIKLSVNAGITVASALIGPPLYRTGDSIPQPNANNREIAWVIARPEGGASSVNAGAYCRGTNELYAQWEAIAGPNWSVDRILKVYKALEKYKGFTNNPAFRGYKGLLDVRQVLNPTDVALTFNQAVINATGFPFVLDYNDPTTPIGSSSQLQYTQNGPDGVFRVSSVNAFLGEDVATFNGKGVDGRKLAVFTKSSALRTLWKGNKAVGVEYLRDGKKKKIYARKGVIVCAGLRSSPFLMYSGVGPRALLESLDIPVIYNNPNVGQGLADQPAMRTIFISNPLDTPLEPQNGLFAQISWLPTPGGDPTIRTLRFATVNPVPGITLGLFDLCQPLSRGSVSINSTNPLAPPVVDLGVFTNSDDLDLFVQGFQTYIRNINTAVQALDPLYELIFPDPEILDDTTALEDFIRENVGCNQHFQSHCRMAPLNQGGVVNSRGKVYGVRNLYVADDSIVPLCMDGSPMATAYLIAANVADLIIEKNQENQSILKLSD